jgi:hypothetical protein
MILKTIHRKSVYIVLGSLLVLLAVNIWYIRETNSDIVSSTKLKIAEQEKRLASIAEVTGRDGADAVVEKIIQDCSADKRARFDTQLSKLPTLKGVELVDVEQLFSTCGNFFAQRKAVMVSRLEREYEMYLDFLEVLALVDSKDAILEYDAERWGVLVKKEVERSALSTKLVEIQGEIINNLKANVSVTSDAMQATLVEGQKTKEALLSISSEIYTLRQSILDI